MHGNQFFGDDLTTVSTTAQYALGTQRYVDAEELLWWFNQIAGTTATALRGTGVAVYVTNHATAATAWVVGNVIGRVAAATDATAAANGWQGIQAVLNLARAHHLLGVAQHAIAAGSSGWILKQGMGEVLAGVGGITADREIIVGAAAGVAIDLGADAGATQAYGQSFGWSAETVLAGALATCYISIP